MESINPLHAIIMETATTHTETSRSFTVGMWDVLGTDTWNARSSRRQGFTVHVDNHTVGTIGFDPGYGRTVLPKFRPNASSAVTPGGAEKYLEGMVYAMQILELYEEATADQRAAEQEEIDRREAEDRERRKKYEAERAERMAAARAEREKRMAKEKAKCEQIYELVKWHLTERMRLRRNGYKSTVFGTIDHAAERWMDITTEKNIPMTIHYKDITILELRESDGPRGKYTTLYKED